MAYDPDRHDRQSIRLPEYDYRLPGAYFVTTCTADRRCLFGTVENGRMRLNDYGRVAAEEWQRTESVRDRVVVDTFIVMPNHTHGVIVITDPRMIIRPTGHRLYLTMISGIRMAGASPMNPYHDKNPD